MDNNKNDTFRDWIPPEEDSGAITDKGFQDFVPAPVEEQNKEVTMPNKVHRESDEVREVQPPRQDYSSFERQEEVKEESVNEPKKKTVRRSATQEVKKPEPLVNKDSAKAREDVAITHGSKADRPNLTERKVK